jgi:hypothetical protein
MAMACLVKNQMRNFACMRRVPREIVGFCRKLSPSAYFTEGGLHALDGIV